MTARKSPPSPETAEIAPTTPNTEESPAMPESTESPLTPKMLASLFNSDSKTIRRFLRNLLETENHPGKGNRWSIDPNALETLKIHFDAFIARRAQTISIDMIAPKLPETK